MRDSFESVLNLARSLPREELPRLLGDLAEISATASARLSSAVVESRPDELLDVRATAKRLGVSEDYLDKFLARIRSQAPGIQPGHRSEGEPRRSGKAFRLKRTHER
jgi:hypothetical protein